MLTKPSKDFIRLHAVGGILTIGALFLALASAVTGLNTPFTLLRDTPLSVTIGQAALTRPVLFWINHLLLAPVIFLLTLELKRQFSERELIGGDRLRLPLLGALGGIAVPIPTYLAFTWPSGMAGGWIATVGTDAALGLAILGLLGDRVPDAMRMFFLTLALFTNLGALLLAGATHAGIPSGTALFLAGGCLLLLLALHLSRHSTFSLYAIVGLILWTVLLPWEGAALAGGFTALFLPGQTTGQERSLLRETCADMHTAVGLLVLPVFVLLNAGAGIGPLTGLFSSQCVGTALGLFLGKQTGIMALCWIGVQTRICALPPGLGWKEIYGAALLGGVGAGMGFALQAVAGPAVHPTSDATAGILLGSLASALASVFVLRHVLARRRNKVIPRG